MTEQTTTTKPTQERAEDGRFALQLKTKRAWQRDCRREVERQRRKEELMALYGDDWCMYA